MSHIPKILRDTDRRVTRKKQRTEDLVRFHDQIAMEPALRRMANTLNVGGNNTAVTQSQNRLNQTLHVLTPVAPNYQHAKDAANAMAKNAELRANHALSSAQRAWLNDIFNGPYGGSTAGRQQVTEHLKERRRQREARDVFSTMASVADLGELSGADLSFVKRGNTIEGMMTSVQTPGPNRGIGFLGSKPSNISGPGEQVPGVGRAIIEHANQLGRQEHAQYMTLGAEGREAQGFYRHMGFEKSTGAPLQPTDFTDHSIDLRKRVV